MFNILKKTDQAKPKTSLSIQVYNGQTLEHPKEGGLVPLVYSSFRTPATLRATVTFETEQELKANDVEVTFRAEAVAIVSSVNAGCNGYYYSNESPFEKIPHYYIRKKWSLLDSAPRPKLDRIQPGTYSKVVTTPVDSAWPSSWHSDHGFVRYIFEASVVKMKFGEAIRSNMTTQEIWVINSTWVQEAYSSQGPRPPMPLETVYGARVDGFRSRLSGLATSVMSDHKKTISLPVVSMTMPNVLLFGGSVAVVVCIDDCRRQNETTSGAKDNVEIHVESAHFVLQEEIMSRSRIREEDVTKTVKDKLAIAINDGWPLIQSPTQASPASPRVEMSEVREKGSESSSSSDGLGNSRKVQRTITLRLPPAPELSSSFSERYLQVSYMFKMTVKLRIGESGASEKDRTLEEVQAKMDVTLTGPSIEAESRETGRDDLLPQYSAYGSTV